MPGWGLSFGVMVLMLSLIVLMPIGTLLLRGAHIGLGEIWHIVNTERVRAALALSFRASLIAALFNLVFGLILAWVLVRYHFWGKRIIDAAIDLPFALPTAVAGIALTAIYAPNGAFGAILKDTFGLRVAYTELGIWIALIFVGLPFVVRTVQPVIEEIDREIEEASATLGASRMRTLRKVILPMLTPALLTGLALALALETEIAPLLIVIRLEEFDYNGAVAIALAMLAISFLMLLAINLIQVWSRRRMGAA
jgi:sulfate transport system permease protein